MSERRSESIHVELKYGDAGLIEQHSLEERIRRAEHDAGMEVGRYGRSSHCWLCRRAWEEQRDAPRGMGAMTLRDRAASLAADPDTPAP